MGRVHRGSNLYSIDFDALQSVVIEANEHLARRQRALLAEVALLDEAEDKSAASYQLGKSVRALLKDMRAARLSDCGPFKQATNVVRGYFDGLEEPLKSALENLKALLVEQQPKRAADDEQVEHVLAVSRDGEPLIEVTTAGASASDIPIEWEVRSIDRTSLDLEALRSIFTPHELQLACRRHLAKHGPHHLQGVTYVRVPVIK